VWWENQLDVLRFHRDLRPGNSQAAAAGHWVVQTEPTALFDKTCRAIFTAVPPELDDGVCRGASDGDRAVIMSVGNPVLWAVATLAFGILAVRVIRTRRHHDATPALVLAFGAVQWLPWAFTEREVFTFYAAPLVPVLAWWIVMAVAPWRRRALVLGIVTVAAVVAFAALRPVMTARPLPPDDLRSSLWYPSWP
jgi:dolichyl-phosphate-mannose-protein mannosyltransferase